MFISGTDEEAEIIFPVRTISIKVSSTISDAELINCKILFELYSCRNSNSLSSNWLIPWSGI